MPPQMFDWMQINGVSDAVLQRAREKDDDPDRIMIGCLFAAAALAAEADLPLEMFIKSATLAWKHRQL